MHLQISQGLTILKSLCIEISFIYSILLFYMTISLNIAEYVTFSGNEILNFLLAILKQKKSDECIWYLKIQSQSKNNSETKSLTSSKGAKEEV